MGRIFIFAGLRVVAKFPIDRRMRPLHHAPMTLNDYLTKKKLTDYAFADIIGAAQSTVCRLRAGGQIPKRDLMLVIFEKTGGSVTPNDFYGIQRPSRKGRAA